jgi:triacylglycerol lipase
VLHDDVHDTHILIAKSARAVYVAMRGTASFENARTDFNMKLVELPHPDDVSVFPPPRVHRGFMHAFTAVWPLVLRCVEDTHRQLSATAPRSTRIDIICTGHSLGGALATLAALFLSWKCNSRIGLYSFGSPRVGRSVNVQSKMCILQT